MIRVPFSAMRVRFLSNRLTTAVEGTEMRDGRGFGMLDKAEIDPLK